jgi:hypothetical protein
MLQLRRANIAVTPFKSQLSRAARSMSQFGEATLERLQIELRDALKR